MAQQRRQKLADLPEELSGRIVMNIVSRAADADGANVRIAGA
jgi:hypothetical protein